MSGTNIKLLQSSSTQIVEPSQSLVTIGPNIKGLRVDQSGTLTINLNDQGSQTWNVLQGEPIKIQGSAIVTTDASCRILVYL